MSFKDECAVFGCWGEAEASRMTYLGLYAQQHRGQESAGIVSLNPEGNHIIRKGLGLVGEVFKEAHLSHLKGEAAIGHVRYSTSGKNYLVNTQPLTAQLFSGPLALAHNGNIRNADELRLNLKEKGAIFQGTNDTECLLHLLAQDRSCDIVECLKNNLPKLKGAYSMTLLTHKELVAVRDPLGFRPLVLGVKRSDAGKESYYISSETCAFDLIGAQYLREVEPGEIIVINDSGITSHRFSEKQERLARCVFEHVYFARPDSIVFSQSVYETRKNLGSLLAKNNPIEADIVIPVPDSGVPAAIGYSQESGIPFEFGIIRNHYIGRTFIQPSSSIRSFGVKIKLNPQALLIKGKRVVVVDDSLVRGTTSKKIINLLKQAGAKEVHFCIASPPTIGACYYGVDTPEDSQLIAVTKTKEQIQEYIGATSLTYLKEENLYDAVHSDSKNYCAACFTRDYPV